MSKPRIIAVANQKGGVGKTTTAVSFAACLAQRGIRVLLIDLDPQGNASTGVGFQLKDRNFSSFDVLTGDASLVEAAVATDFDNLDLIPATSDLASADIELASRRNRAGQLRNALLDDRHQVVVIDCPPALGLLTLNALVAANAVLVPLQAEYFALEGLSQLLQTVRQIRQQANPGLRIEGVVMTMTDGRNNLSQQVEQDARATLGDLVYETTIPRNVRLSETPSFAKPIIHYDKSSRGALAYQAMTEEYLKRNAQGGSHG